VKSNNKRPMIVTRGDLLRSMLKRFPNIKFYDMMNYVNIIINILVTRVMENRITIVDGFGVLYRKKSKPRKILNIRTRIHQYAVAHTVVFHGHKSFIETINLDKVFIKEMLKENSIKQLAVRINKKKLI